MLEGSQVPTAEQMLALRKEGGRWLKARREAAGLSQRQLHALVAPTSPRTIVSSIENGRLSIPTERYEDWATALGLHPKVLTQVLIQFYDPILYSILFTDDGKLRPLLSSAFASSDQT